MRPVMVLDAPARMQELWAWVAAMCAFDYGDPLPLASIVSSGVPIPEEFRMAVAMIIEGRRKPGRKAGAKAKIAPVDRMFVAARVSIIVGRWGAILKGMTTVGGPPVGGKDGIARIADESRAEPIQIIRRIQLEQRYELLKAAEELGVSEETVEDLLRDMRARIARWPEV